MRGFTLIELIVALGLASIGSIAIFEVLRGQLQAHYDQGRVGDAQANGRIAIDAIVQRIEAAGFGLPSTAVFPTATTSQLDNAPPSDIASTCPGTDVFETHARDPRGTWTVSSATTAGSLAFHSFGGTADIPWLYGQRVEIFVGPGQVDTLRTASARAATVLTVTLNTSESSANFAPTTQALDQTEAYMISVSRFRVSCVDQAHPTLVLEDDTDVNNDGKVDQNDALPIANDIEDLQVAYFQDTDQNNLLDAIELATPLAAQAGGGYAAVTDWTMVKAMRVTVVARSPNSGQPKQSVTSSPVTLENHTPAPTTDYYFRRTLGETVYFDNRNTSNPVYEHISNKFL